MAAVEPAAPLAVELEETQQQLREQHDRNAELSSRVRELERDHRRAEDVKRDRIDLVERDRQVAGLVEQMVCICGESQCPRCAALELLQR